MGSCRFLEKVAAQRHSTFLISNTGLPEAARREIESAGVQVTLV